MPTFHQELSLVFRLAEPNAVSNLLRLSNLTMVTGIKINALLALVLAASFMTTYRLVMSLTKRAVPENISVATTKDL